MDPIKIFHRWYQEEINLTKVRLPSACCLSSNGTDGFPNARFVSLKEVIEGNFIITGPLNSRKGIEINKSQNVALTFWWPETERQVRIQGVATKISNQLADKYFFERNRDSQIVSIVSNQGKEIENLSTLVDKFETLKTEQANKLLDRPDNWGGFSISPVRIELLEFNETRFHDRKLFELHNAKWTVKQIQP